VTTSSSIVLASGQVTRADRLSVELVQLPDLSVVTLSRWPPQAVRRQAQREGAGDDCGLDRASLEEAQAALAKINTKPHRKP
jgi:hypothetical protein